jgi:hypothetical protein
MSTIERANKMIVNVALENAGFVQKPDDGVHGFSPLLDHAITVFGA